MRRIQITLRIDDDVILPARYIKIVLITIRNQMKFRCRKRTEMVKRVLNFLRQNDVPRLLLKHRKIKHKSVRKLPSKSRGQLINNISILDKLFTTILYDGRFKVKSFSAEMYFFMSTTQLNMDILP